MKKEERKFNNNRIGIFNFIDSLIDGDYWEMKAEVHFGL